MQIDKSRAKNNLEYAELWLSRARKDFRVFKLLVSFNKRTNKPVTCSDPALTIYMLQQTIEKAVKAAAIASEQYKYKDFRHYSHNSLALILNLNSKIAAKVNSLGLNTIGEMMGFDLKEGLSRFNTVENQVTGKVSLIDSKGEKVDFRTESMGMSSVAINNILDSITANRNLFLNVIRTTFSVLPGLGIHHGKGIAEDPQAFINILSAQVTDSLKLKPPTEEQLKAPLEFIRKMGDLGFKPDNILNRNDMITNYLGVWAFANSLYL